MKKNLVFVIPSLDAGGAEKSLVNLLNTIDYSLYDVDLVLFHNRGTFLSLLPKEVAVVTLNSNYFIFTKGLPSSILGFLKKARLDLAWNRLLFFLKNKFIKDKAIAEQSSWQNCKPAINVLSKEYDAAIGFLEKSSIYFVLDKVKANKKIGWIHTNYSNSGMKASFDLNYFKKLDALVAVSPDCVSDLKNNFPTIKDKIHVVFNIISTKTILALAAENTKELKENTIVTIARLSHEKGCDLAVEAAKILKERNVNFLWLVIGEGSERSSLEAKIKEYQLEEYFQLIGLHQNPYPFIKAAKLYVQPSRYEGKSMAIEEAKILQKPTIVTNYLTARDQIEPNITGIIAEINAESIANAVENLLSNEAIQMKLTQNLSTQNFGTEDEIIKLYHLIHE